MSMTVLERVELDEALDWAIACQEIACLVGHPIATHMIIHLQCVCPPKPVCTDCAAGYQSAIDEKYEPELPPGMDERACRWCGCTFTGDLSRQYKVEPLP